MTELDYSTEHCPICFDRAKREGRQIEEIDKTSCPTCKGKGIIYLHHGRIVSESEFVRIRDITVRIEIEGDYKYICEYCQRTYTSRIARTPSLCDECRYIHENVDRNE